MSAVSLPMLEDRRSYVYAHAKATTGEIFYIGKGTGGRAYNTKQRSDWHKAVAARHGVDVHVLEKNLTAREALAREIVLIAEGREIGLDLVNMTAGGDGMLNPTPDVRARHKAGIEASMTPERRARMSESFKAAMTPERRAQISASQIGRVTSDATKAKKRAAFLAANTPEYREQQRRGATGRKQSAETIAKRVASCAGRVVSAQSKERMSAAKSGKKLSPEHCQKLSAAKLGKAKSPEHQAKITAAVKASWARRKAKQSEEKL